MMSDTYEPPSNAGDEDVTTQLLRLAGGRLDVPLARDARVRAAVHAEWQAIVRRRRARRRTLAASALATAASLVLLLVWRNGGESPVPATAGPTVASVERIDGSSRLEPGVAGAGDVLLALNDPVRARDLVATPADGRVALRFPGATSVRLDVGSRLRVLSEDVVELLAGAVYIDTGGETTRFEVRAAFATARDIGTQFEVRLIEEAVRLRVRTGAVVLSDAGRSVTAREDTEVIMSGDGAVSRPIARNEDAWSWVTRVAPPVDFEGLSLAEFLDRLAREQGWTVRYTDEPLARDAASVVLHGSASGLTPREAVEVAISTSGLRHEFEGRTLHVLRGEARR